MSTTQSPTLDKPLLFEGQRISQPEFHTRYEAMPSGTYAELIEGVVCMASPVGVAHSEEHFAVVAWLSRYRAYTPGVRGHDNASVVLDESNEVQPDALLRIESAAGGQTRADAMIHGAPELVVEVADSSRRLDLGAKLAQYERAGVVDYIVRTIDPDAVLWHTRRDGKLVVIEPDGDGLYRSAACPGLWLDPLALLANDLPRVWAAVDRGVATPEHAEFAARLAQARVVGRPDQ